jgi:hypothetical protein
MKTRSIWVLLFCTSIITGCAVGQTYNYQQADIELPVMGEGKLGLAVLDNRPYVLSGDKKANFVGLQRGGFGNPFDVTTGSGNPLAEVFYVILAAELSENGFEVMDLHLTSSDGRLVAGAITSSGAHRSVILTVDEWKTDAFMNFGLTYDLDLQIFDESGSLLAEKDSSGHEDLGGAGMESRNSDVAIQSFESRVGKLFNSPEIKSVLQ